MDLRAELQVAEQAARAAGELIRVHYERGTVAIETKADASPVTEADKDANAAILAILQSAFPADAILSEETPDTEARLTNHRVWIIDPLDGTKDFINRSGEFCVHVGLAIEGHPVVGAVYQPITGVMASASKGHGAWRSFPDGRRERLHVGATSALTAVRVGTSRAYPSAKLVAFLDEHGIAQRVAMGASTKLVAVAAGELDCVINLGSAEMEWDSCAPEVIVREAGGAYSDRTGQAFRYNQADPMHHRGSIASNGACHAAVVAALAEAAP
ncbi:MAG: 3'(2'),5'-bisphosphate nucleotidase CysQ [Myxococcales bacterium]|nr:3'(2'),5'-bisphosphate nucleotidase CysQ [Myxococcales bacterium]